MRDINLLVVHTSATPRFMDIGVAEIRQWHLAKGWSDVGYHSVIRRNGIIEIVRPIERVGAHAKGYNKNSIGICLVGGLNNARKPDNNYTRAQKVSLYFLLMTLKRTWIKAEVLGHRDLSPDLNHDGIITSNEWVKACPCFDVKPWWQKALQGELT